MRPETALVIRKIIEAHFNNFCATFHVPEDREAYYNQLLDHIRETFPGRDCQFYGNICRDFLEHLLEPANLLEQSEPWGKSPQMEDFVRILCSREGEPPGAAETLSPYPPPTEVEPGLETRLVLEQITALGNCLMAIAAEKELQSRKQTFVSLGTLLHQIVQIVKDLLAEKEFDKF